MGDERTAFVIGADGKIGHISRKLEPADRDAQVQRRRRSRRVSGASRPEVVSTRNTTLSPSRRSNSSRTLGRYWES